MLFASALRILWRNTLLVRRCRRLLSPGRTRCEEVFFLGLRLNRGVDLREVAEQFGREAVDKLAAHDRRTGLRWTAATGRRFHSPHAAWPAALQRSIPALHCSRPMSRSKPETAFCQTIRSVGQPTKNSEIASVHAGCLVCSFFLPAVTFCSSRRYVLISFQAAMTTWSCLDAVSCHPPEESWISN